MVPAKETAEEQLLRMIEGPAAPSPSRSPMRPFSFVRLLDRVRSWIDRLRRGGAVSPRHQESADALLVRLRIAERIFWALLISLGLYLVLDLFVFQLHPPQPRARAAAVAVRSPGAAGGPGDTPLKSL